MSTIGCWGWFIAIPIALGAIALCVANPALAIVAILLLISLMGYYERWDDARHGRSHLR